MNRRGFLTTLATAAPAVVMSGHPGDKSGNVTSEHDALGSILPKRRLGRTGEQVTMLGIGGYHVGWTSEKDAVEVIEAAMEGGIRFFDTAEAYQQGESEIRYGKYLTPKYRDHIYLMTKTQARDAKTAREHLEGSLRRMKTDHLDLWQLHTLRNPDDVDGRLQEGVLEVLIKAKEEGKVRHIGFTGHTNPEAHLHILEKTAGSDPFDTCQMPVNVIDPSYHSFIEQVLPSLQEKNIGLLAMKTLADGRFLGIKTMPNRGAIWRTDDPAVPNRLSIRDALHFAWSLPVSVLITGAENASLVREKVDMAKTFTGMTAEERLELVNRVADLADGKIEYYKRPLES
ncbi:aldo/keto reductase [Puniceicoccales bacterium CK1056]|uniref:Aldo/keto reductase n=1 Tax=Oceanipulchritudo coccoides TaxID=2706888 RepID=A0A6B2M3I1_9BACT|nr:aldo/keto reductase [Oceanipulchritudo coccoides]NDV62862.1 aldo/keto reductase [Oceanipulchritudo coccoides]